VIYFSCANECQENHLVYPDYIKCFYIDKEWDRSPHYTIFEEWISHLNSSGISRDLGINFNISNIYSAKRDLEFLSFCYACIENTLPQVIKTNYSNNDIFVCSQNTVSQEIIDSIIDYSQILNNKPISRKRTVGGGGIERYPILGRPYVNRYTCFIMGDRHTLLQYSKPITLKAALANIPLVNSYSVLHPKNVFECIENYLKIKNDYKN